MTKNYISQMDFKRPHVVVKKGRRYLVDGPEADGQEHNTEEDARHQCMYMDHDWQTKEYGSADPALEQKVMQDLAYGLGGFSWSEICGPDGDAGHKG